MAIPAKVGRNDLCHCGSGKKFKKCHGAKAEGGLTPWQRIGFVLAVAALVGGLALAFMSREDHAARSSGVWDPAHGHYH